MRRSNVFLFGVLILIASMLMSCFGNMNTVETCVLSNVPYNDKAGLERAKQLESLEASRNIYASVHFIESPLGMEYTTKWYVNGNEVKTETKAMATNRQGIIIYPLEADRVVAGKIRFEILYHTKVLFSKELSVQ